MISALVLQRTRSQVFGGTAALDSGPGSGPPWIRFSINVSAVWRRTVSLLRQERLVGHTREPLGVGGGKAASSSHCQ